MSENSTSGTAANVPNEGALGEAIRLMRKHLRGQVTDAGLTEDYCKVCDTVVPFGECEVCLFLRGAE